MLFADTVEDKLDNPEKSENTSGESETKPEGEDKTTETHSKMGSSSDFPAGGISLGSPGPSGSLSGPLFSNLADPLARERGKLKEELIAFSQTLHLLLKLCKDHLQIQTDLSDDDESSDPKDPESSTKSEDLNPKKSASEEAINKQENWWHWAAYDNR